MTPEQEIARLTAELEQAKDIARTALSEGTKVATRLYAAQAELAASRERERGLREAVTATQAAYAAMSNLPEIAPVGICQERLNIHHQFAHAAADAFWAHWKHSGETHKHGYYESTWGAINAAIKLVGTFNTATDPSAHDVPYMISDAELRAVLADAVQFFGSQKRLAEEMGVSETYLSDVINHRRHVSSAISKHLGYKRVRMYVKRAALPQEAGDEH